MASSRVNGTRMTTYNTVWRITPTKSPELRSVRYAPPRFTRSATAIAPTMPANQTTPAETGRCNCLLRRLFTCPAIMIGTSTARIKARLSNDFPVKNCPMRSA